MSRTLDVEMWRTKMIKRGNGIRYGKNFYDIITNKIKVTNKIPIIYIQIIWLVSHAVSYRKSDYMARKSWCKL